MNKLEVIISAIAGILALCAKLTWKKTNTFGKLAFVAGFFALLIVAITKFKDDTKEINKENVSSTVGEMSDNTQITIPKMSIAHTKSMMLFPTGMWSLPPNYKDLFRLYSKGSKLYLDAVIKDSKGENIAVLSENIWKWYGKSYEYNNDDKAFEIVTEGERNIFFQVDLENGIANIAGYFYKSAGYGILFYPNNDVLTAVKYPGSFMMITPSTPDSIIPAYIGHRIFKYPRELYLGIREVREQ